MKKNTHLWQLCCFLLLGLPLSMQAQHELFEAKRLEADYLQNLSTVFFVPRSPNAPAMIYCNMNDSLTGNSLPIALIHSTSQGWLVVKPDSAFINHTWIYAGASDVSGQIWWILQPSNNDLQQITPEKIFYFFVSDDKGFSFKRVGDLPLPTPFCEVRRFTVDAKGRAELTFYAPDEGTESPGYYTYRSKDGGKSWQKTEFDANFMHDPVFDAQTPPTDLLQGLLDN